MSFDRVVNERHLAQADQVKPRGKPTPLHPGIILRRMLLPGAGMTASQISRALELHRTSLHEVLHGRKAISPSLAVRLAAMFGVPATVWLNLQQRHDIHMAEEELQDELTEIEPYAGPPLDIEFMIERLEHARRPVAED